MSRGNRFGFTLLASVIVAVFFLAAAPVPSSQGMSVGQFVTLVAAHLQPAAKEKTASSPEAAVDVLNNAGVRVKGDLASPLTAGDATDIFQQLGITLTAQHPGTLLEKDRATALVATFGDSFRVQGSAGSPASTTVSPNRGTTGAPAPTLEDLDFCQNLPKVKDCHDCCKALGIPNRTCGQACGNSPKASAMEPTP